MSDHHRLLDDPVPSSPLRNCYTSSGQEPLLLDYLAQKRTSQELTDAWSPSPPASPLTNPATSLRTTRRVKTSSDIAQSQDNKRVVDKTTKAARRHGQIFDESWASLKADNERKDAGIVPLSTQEQRNTWPKEHDPYEVCTQVRHDMPKHRPASSRRPSDSRSDILTSADGEAASQSRLQEYNEDDIRPQLPLKGPRRHTSDQEKTEDMQLWCKLPFAQLESSGSVGDVERHSNSQARLKQRILGKNNLHLKLQLPPTPVSFPARKHRWDGTGTNAPISMGEAQEINLRTRRVEKQGSIHSTALSYGTCICQSPTSYTQDGVGRSRSITTHCSLPTHPALLARPQTPSLPPRKQALFPDPRFATRHAILTQTKYCDASSDGILADLWAKLRAGVWASCNEGNKNNIATDVQRQIQLCRGLSGAELENAIQERVDDMDMIRKWVEKWREKEVETSSRF